MVVQDDLVREMRDEIARIPVIDLHSHLRWHRPQAGHLAEMVFYHFLTHEMLAAGMPPSVFTLSDPAEKLRAALPWLDLVRYSGTAYCLRRMLQDLYGMEEEWLSASNLDEMIRRVSASAEDEQWPIETFRRGHIAKAFVSDRGWGQLLADGHPDFARYNGLFQLALETGFIYEEGFRKRERLERWPARNFTTLTDSFDDSRQPASLEEFARRPYAWFREGDWPLLRACLGWTSTHFRWRSADRYAEETAFTRYKAGRTLDDADVNRLRLVRMRAMLDDCRRTGKTFQIFYGSRVTRMPGHFNYTDVVYDPETFQNFARLADEYADVSMDIFLCSVLNSQEAAIMAKMRPNIHLAGIWWHGMYPSYIRRILADRLDTVPLSKTTLFFSDAYMTEWTYGKRRLVERELALLLAERVRDGYLTRADATRIARAWMYENPARRYGIEVAAASEAAETAVAALSPAIEIYDTTRRIELSCPAAPVPVDESACLKRDQAMLAETLVDITPPADSAGPALAAALKDTLPVIDVPPTPSPDTTADTTADTTTTDTTTPDAAEGPEAKLESSSDAVSSTVAQ